MDGVELEEGDAVVVVGNNGRGGFIKTTQPGPKARHRK
jgi:hypothetical protein